jgi:hypothetical protein
VAAEVAAENQVVDYAGPLRQTSEDSGYEQLSGTENEVAMKDSVPPQDTPASDPTIARGASRPEPAVNPPTHSVTV